MTYITLDNSLIVSDSNIGDLRRQVENSHRLLDTNKYDMGSAEHYKRGNGRSKPALQKLWRDEGISYVDRNNRQQLAESLASNFRINRSLDRSRNNALEE